MKTRHQSIDVGLGRNRIKVRDHAQSLGLVDGGTLLSRRYSNVFQKTPSVAIASPSTLRAINRQGMLSPAHKKFGVNFASQIRLEEGA